MPAPKLFARKRTAATVLAAVAIIGLGGVLAGCGSDDDKSSSNSQSNGDANSATNPAAAGLPVPNVVYQDAAVAMDTLQKKGFTNVKLEAADGGAVATPSEWTVDSQSVLPGTNSAADGQIVLTCVKKKLAPENSGTGGSQGPPVVVSGVWNSKPVGPPETTQRQGSGHADLRARRVRQTGDPPVRVAPARRGEVAGECGDRVQDGHADEGLGFVGPAFAECRARVVGVGGGVGQQEHGDAPHERELVGGEGEHGGQGRAPGAFPVRFQVLRVGAGVAADARDGHAQDPFPEFAVGVYGLGQLPWQRGQYGGVRDAVVLVEALL